MASAPEIIQGFLYHVLNEVDLNRGRWYVGRTGPKDIHYFFLRVSWLFLQWQRTLLLELELRIHWLRAHVSTGLQYPFLAFLSFQEFLFGHMTERYLEFLVQNQRTSTVQTASRGPSAPASPGVFSSPQLPDHGFHFLLPLEIPLGQKSPGVQYQRAGSDWIFSQWERWVQL